MPFEPKITVPTSLTPHDDVYPFIDPARFQPQGSLANKTALITGAGRGIGKATALSFAKAGCARVICVARRQDDVDATAKEITSTYPSTKAIGVAADVSKTDAAEHVLSTAKSTFGDDEGIVDVLVNAAGMTRFNAFENESSSSLDDWWRVLEVNLRGSAMFSRAVIPGMRTPCRKGGEGGVIVQFASTSGSQDIPFNSAYAVSKAGVIKFNQDVGFELANSSDPGERKIRCYALQPGSVQTDLQGGEGAVNMDAAKKHGKMQETFAAFYAMKSFQKPELAAGTAVTLAVEDSDGSLNGRYVDAHEDLEEVLRDARKGAESRIEKEKLYQLKMDQL